MTSTYAAKLGLKVYLINVKAPKIDNFTFKKFKIVHASL